MFTGIIEEIGTVKSIKHNGESAQLTVECNKILEDTKFGDSISTNGVCLTVCEYRTNSYTADVMMETMKKTNLSALKIGDRVNLERALKVGDRLGGHYVTGHVDGTGEITSIKKCYSDVLIEIKPQQELLNYMVDKGCISVDGISLTIVKVFDRSFTLSIIPTTSNETTLVTKQVGDSVNIECDIFAKYIQRQSKNKKESITLQMLKVNGFM